MVTPDRVLSMSLIEPICIFMLNRIAGNRIVLTIGVRTYAQFSIATTPRCGGNAPPFPRSLYFTLDPHFIMLSVKQGGDQVSFFESLV